MSLSKRRDRNRDNAFQTNNTANEANRYANETQSYSDQAVNAWSDATQYANEASGPIKEMLQLATEVESKITTSMTKIRTSAAKIVTETKEEREDLNKIVALAEKEINKINEVAKSVRAAASSANASANSARENANFGRPGLQGYVNSARYDAGESRKYADECNLTAYHRGDGGDDQRSNNDRSNCETYYNRTIQSYNTVKNVANYVVPRMNNAKNARDNVNNQVKIFNEGLKQVSVAITTYEPQVLKAIIDYANDHNFDWLYGEIERIKPILQKYEEQLPPDLKEEKDVIDKKKEYEKSLLDYLEQLKAENAKGSLADQTSKELEALEIELTKCTDKIDEYKKSLGLTNGRIGILAQQLITEQTLFTAKDKEKKNAFNEMNNTTKKYNDLSGELIKLQTDKSKIEGLITSEQSKYIELKKRIEILNKKIDELKIKDYSTKVYNNENLLELNKIIDNDLKKTFSYLKTENINPDLLYSKIKYRQIEKEKLSNADKLLDILFYCFYFSFIIIRIVTRNTKAEDFLMYILIGIIPLIYPFMYKNSNYISNLFNLDTNKNAFIEPESQPEFLIDAYNI